MKYRVGPFVIGACLLAATVVPATAGEPSTPLAHTSPAVRIEVVVRNLWDVLWNNPQTRTLTGEKRFDWRWLAARCDKDANATVTREEFPGASDTFTRLDRNWDGKLTAEDFDWSGNGTLGRQKATTFALFKSIDKSSDGRINSEEWQAAFARLAQDKGYLNDHELEELIFQPAVVKSQRERKMFEERSTTRSQRLARLIESGRFFTDGPRPGELAPDFKLSTPDGKTTVALSSYRGKKPVVLIFGSFT
jgi:Ca2+-binding EF-hand superfamily protein